MWINFYSLIPPQELPALPAGQHRALRFFQRHYPWGAPARLAAKAGISRRMIRRLEQRGLVYAERTWIGD